MSKFKFDLKNRQVLDTIRSPYIYEFNLARNLALLSNDPAVIRYFYQNDAPKLTKDQWLIMQITDRFLAQYTPGQAFNYFGIIPMIVQAKVNLVASNGFKCKSDDEELDERLNEFIDEARLGDKFAEGVYLESGLGDFAYRLSYDPDISDKPLISVIEPQHLEVNYNKGRITSFVIKESSEENADYELREIYTKNVDGDIVVLYRYYFEGTVVDPAEEFKIKECKQFFPDVDISEKVLPLKEFPIVFKKNANSNQLYKGERGVPDIQGLDTIEDALTESISDLIDAIRKGGIKEYVDDSLIPQDEKGNDLRLNHFNKTIVTTKGSSTPGQGKNLWQVTQGDIRWQAYTETIKTLISTAINKAGLSPTTLGLTGLESINSSAESQEARERTSLRTRELCLSTWERTLNELLNRYLQVIDYIKGRDIGDYSSLIKIHFNDYINPSTESITEVLAKQVAGGIKSQKHAIMDLNKEYDEEDAEQEMMDILAEKGATVLQDGVPADAENMENITPKNDNLGDSDLNTAELENSNSTKG